MSGHLKGSKTDVYEMSGVLKIEHEHFTGWVDATNDGSYISGHIKFYNVSQLPMADVKVYLDLDDTGTTWDAVVVDVNGQAIPGGVQDLGNIPAGKYAEKTYWWKVNHFFGPTKETFNVVVNIIPQFQISYTKYDAFKGEPTKVTTV